MMGPTISQWMKRNHPRLSIRKYAPITIRMMPSHSPLGRSPWVDPDQRPCEAGDADAPAGGGEPTGFPDDDGGVAAPLGCVRKPVRKSSRISSLIMRRRAPTLRVADVGAPCGGSIRNQSTR